MTLAYYTASHDTQKHHKAHNEPLFLEIINSVKDSIFNEELGDIFLPVVCSMNSPIVAFMAPALIYLIDEQFPEFMPKWEENVQKFHSPRTNHSLMMAEMYNTIVNA